MRRWARETCVEKEGSVPRWARRRNEALGYFRRPAPWLTLWLCVAMFVMLGLQFAVLQSRFAASYLDVFVLRVDWWAHPWTLLTSLFSHQGPGHLWVNVTGLIVLGPLAERWLGCRRFVGVFIGFGIAASLVGLYTEVIFSTKGGDASSLGSSSAVWALIGVVLVGLAVRWYRALWKAGPLRRRSFLEMVWVIAATPVAHEITGGAVSLFLLGGLASWESSAPGIGRVGNVAHVTGLLLGGVWAACWFTRSRYAQAEALA